MEEEGNKKNENGNGRAFEEEVYWTNFKSMRFFQSLSGDFLSQLMIPKKFSENVRDKLPQTVILKGPGGATWNVQLARVNNDTLFLGDGWKDFVKAHQLKENDLLFFKYKRDSSFKVWVFNGKNLCENTGSYFVRKSTSGKSNGSENWQPKRKAKESSVEDLVSEEDSDYDGSGSEWAPAGTSRRKGRRSSIHGSKTTDARVKYPNTPYTPSKRSLSEEEKEGAIQMAKRESTFESFNVVMKPTHFLQNSRLCIPAKWAKCYLAPENQDVVLRVGNKQWRTRLNVTSQSGTGVISSGWRSFVSDNLLQEFDVCLFKLGSAKNEPVILDVTIFPAGVDVNKRHIEHSSLDAK